MIKDSNKKYRRTGACLLVFLCLVFVFSCRKLEIVVPTEYEIISDNTYSSSSSVRGMYLVNEGNMGSNKCTLDYLDYPTMLYARNFYAEKNPNVVKELGDVGNDIQIYGNRLYVVVNCSHKVEVLDAHTGVRIGQVDIPNCRYIRFYRGYAYVSSYVGPVLIDPNAPLGAVYKVDTASLEVKAKVSVGYQPEEMEIIDDYMYVANSGGYRAELGYDNTISVIEMEGFKQVEKIPVSINLHRVKKDNRKQLWVSSRGDYRNVKSNLFVLAKKSGYNRMEVIKTMDIPCSNMAVHGDSIYLYSTEWNDFAAQNTVSYAIVNTLTLEVVSRNFITDGTEKDITIPYGIAVHPENGDIYITDAKNYVSSGTLYCYDRYGKRKWSVRTGDIPAHMVFLYK